MADLSKRISGLTRIGQEGNATIVRGLLDNETPVLIRLYANVFAAQPEVRKRFGREFAAASKIGSPYVTKYFGWYKSRTHFGVVTEYVGQSDLRAKMALDGKLSIDEALPIARMLCEGLHACHRQGIVHRDVRPENILMSGERIVLSNLSLATVSRQTALTMTGVMLSAPEYSPPEAFHRRADTISADIYSAGVVLWEALAGRQPFMGLALRRIVEEKAEPLPRVSVVRAEVPEWLDLLIESMTSPAQEARPASFETVIQAIDKKSFRPSAAEDHRLCLACGYGLSEMVPFCLYCADDKRSGPDEAFSVILERAHDPESLSKKLIRLFGDLPKQHSRISVPAVISHDLSDKEASFVAEEIRAAGGQAVKTPTPVAHLRSAAIVLTLFIAFCINGLEILTFPFNDSEFLKFAPPEFAAAQVRAMVGIGIVLLIAMWVVQQRAGMKVREIPGLWWRGSGTVPSGKYQGWGRNRISVILLMVAGLGGIYFAAPKLFTLFNLAMVGSMGGKPIELFDVLILATPTVILALFVGGSLPRLLFSKQPNAFFDPGSDWPVWKEYRQGVQNVTDPAGRRVLYRSAFAFLKAKDETPSGTFGGELADSLREAFLRCISNALSWESGSRSEDSAALLRKLELENGRLETVKMRLEALSYEDRGDANEIRDMALKLRGEAREMELA